MYDKQLHPIQDGEVLVAYFAKICPNKKKQISAEDFELLKVIGRGGFSRVILCRKKDTGRLYAMKILKKSKIIREKKIKPILSERSILEKLDHPFIVKLHWAFQSKEELFFVLDICTGGEIFFHLNNFKKFPEQLAKFYFIEIILGLEYLHRQEIVYRDIKPENILVDIDGHIKIADFGLAKYIPHRQKSYSFCGSPEYMSPEMLKGRGHDKQLDYYCLGALLYEMLTGLPPYYSKDTNEMYKRILNDDLSFPDYLHKLPLIVDLLTKLLSKDPKTRIKNIDEIKQHPWLKETPWKKYLNKQIMPPFVPSMREPNFDPEFNDLPIDFDELQIKLRMSTERRQSYYYESTLQSKTCTENSFYFNNHPMANQVAVDFQPEEVNVGNTLINTNQALFQNFFSNPGDDIKDIYNDSSGTNNTSNANTSIPNIKQRPSGNQQNQSQQQNMNNNNHSQYQNNSNNQNQMGNSLNNQSANSNNQDNSDVFRNFSFYDSPLEENEILSQIKKCCIKIGQLPQHLYPTNPTTASSNQQQQQNKQQLSQNLQKLQSNMSQWMSSSRRLIQEELDEEDGETSNQKSSQDQEGEEGQLHALPSEFSGNSICIEQSDIAIDSILHTHNNAKKQTSNNYDYKDSLNTLKNKETSDETWKQIDSLQIIMHHSKGDNIGQTHQIVDDFANVVGSFSSKSINTYDESNQSVAQELRTNESIALNTYSIANMKYTGPPNGHSKLMNSDELIVNEIDQMAPVIKNHQYKKSMINPTQFKPSLEIQLPEIDHEALLHKQIKQDSSTHKTSPFLPKVTTPSKKDEKINMKYNSSGKDLLAMSQQKQSPKYNDNKKKKINDNNANNYQTCSSLGNEEPPAQGITKSSLQQSISIPQSQPKTSFINNSSMTNQQKNAESLMFKFNQSPQVLQKIQDMNYSSSPLSVFQSNQQINQQQQQMVNQQQSSPDYKIHSRIQEQLIIKKSFLQDNQSNNSKMVPLIGQNSNKFNQMDDMVTTITSESNKLLQQKRQAAKFRSMDFSQNNEQKRTTSLKNEERIIIEPRNIDEMYKQEILSDLKEASKEGGNSISMSPLRSCLPDMKPNHGHKIQTLKGASKVTTQALPKGKNTTTTMKNKLESDQVSTTQANKTGTIKKDLNPKSKMKPSSIKIEQQMPQMSTLASKKSPTQQQQMLQIQQQQQQLLLQQQKQIQQQQPIQKKAESQPSQQQQQQQQQQVDEQQTDPKDASSQQTQGKTPHSSKNASNKPNLFSEKSQPSLQIINTNTPTTQGGQITIPSTIKGKIDFFNSNKDYGSIGAMSTSTTSNQQQSISSSSQVHSTKQSVNKVQTSIKKKLQQQMEGTISRNDNNPKITGSSGAVQTGTGGSIGSKKSQPSTLTKKKI